jgi:hypothetical protein
MTDPGTSQSVESPTGAAAAAAPTMGVAVPGDVDETPAVVTATAATGVSRRRIAIGAGVLVALVVLVTVAIAALSRGDDTPLADGATTTTDQAAIVQPADVGQSTTSTTTSTTTTRLPAVVAAVATTTTAAATTSMVPPEIVEILGIDLKSGRYLVEYETTGYTERLPGLHVHFYWNNIYEEQAGVGPIEADWFVWGGPRPFDGYTVSERPSGVTAMCSVVANPDHTIKLGTGNCHALP